MADGDIIHPNLSKRFQRVYGEICEGHWEPTHLGYKLLHPLKKQLQVYGNGPILLGKNLAPILESVASDLKNGKPFHFDAIKTHMDLLSKRHGTDCTPRGRDLILNAANKLLVGFQNGILPTNIEHALYKTYIDTVYVKDFESRIHNTSQHYKDASRAEIANTIHEIRPYVERGQNEFAKQIMRYSDIKKIKRPRKLKEPPPTITDSAW